MKYQKIFALTLITFFLFFQSCGIDVSQVINMKEFSLHESVKNGDIAKVKKLILAGADINQLDKEYTTPLLYAVQIKDLKIAQILINAGADVNQLALNIDRIALSQSILYDDLPMVNLLITNGAIADQGLPYALAHEKMEILKHMIDFAQFDDKQSALNQALVSASEVGHMKTITYLLEKGAEIDPGKTTNEKISENKAESYQVLTQPLSTALSSAAGGGHLEVVKFFHEKGASLVGAFYKSIEQSQYFPKKNHYAVAAFLLENGLDIKNELLRFPNTVSFAARNEDPRYLKLLIEHGADISVKDVYGRPPLYAAVERGRTENVRILLKHGTSIDSKALSMAANKKNPALLKLLLENGADKLIKEPALYNPVLYTAALNDDLESFKLLLEYEADIHALNSKGENSFHAVIQSDQIEIAKILVEKKVISVRAKIF